MLLTASWTTPSPFIIRQPSAPKLERSLWLVSIRLPSPHLAANFARTFKGYSKGFRTVFFFNGACIALAAVLAICFIREFPLTREDEMDQKESAKEWLRTKGKRA